MTQTQNRLIGAHVSAAGGVENAITRVAKIDANCVQVFSGSPRVWARKPLSEVDPEKVSSKQHELSVSPIFTHALYLVNLASEKAELRRKSVRVLKHDLEFDSLLGGSGVVVHLGSHQGRGWEAVRELVRDEIIAVLKDTPADSTFLIENSAGQNGKLCSELSEIRWLLDEVKKANPNFEQRLGWCVDTCHAFAAGYALGESARSNDNKNQQAQSLAAAITEYDLWPSLKCIHVNDSKDPFGSGRDRHENIGDGQIPQEDLQYFLNVEQVRSIPLITEVPGLDGKGPDAANIQRIRDLVSA